MKAVRWGNAVRFLVGFGLLCIVAALVLVQPQPAKADLPVNPWDYYASPTYSFAFSKTDIQGSETFTVTISGQVTCIKTPPISSISVTVSGKVVAQQSGTEKILNANYSMSYSSFPSEVGRVASTIVTVPLSFPTNSPAGTYSVVAQIIQAKATALGLITVDITSALPSSQAMGSVNYQVARGGSGGGGGASVGGTIPSQPMLVTNLTGYMNSSGMFTREARAMSGDAAVEIKFSGGTEFKTPDGIGTSVVMLEVDKSKVSPPANSAIIGKVYDILPNGATFSQPIQMTFVFDKASLPVGVQAKDLVIAWWDISGNRWVILEDCQVNETASTVSGMVNHFTMFTLIGAIPPPPPTTPATPSQPSVTTASSSTPIVTTPTTSTPTTSPLPTTTPTTVDPTPKPTPLPAALTISDLQVSPVRVAVGKNVAISVFVTNTGDQSGEFEIPLKINGVAVETKKITLASKSSQRVSFTTSGGGIGSYTGQIDTLTGTFTVVPTPKVTSSWLVGGLVAIVVIAIGTVVLVVMLKKSPGRI